MSSPLRVLVLDAGAAGATAELETSADAPLAELRSLVLSLGAALPAAAAVDGGARLVLDISYFACVGVLAMGLSAAAFIEAIAAARRREEELLVDLQDYDYSLDMCAAPQRPCACCGRPKRLRALPTTAPSLAALTVCPPLAPPKGGRSGACSRA